MLMKYQILSNTIKITAMKHQNFEKRENKHLSRMFPFLIFGNKSKCLHFFKSFILSLLPRVSNFTILKHLIF